MPAAGGLYVNPKGESRGGTIHRHRPHELEFMLLKDVDAAASWSPLQDTKQVLYNKPDPANPPGIGRSTTSATGHGRSLDGCGRINGDGRSICSRFGGGNAADRRSSIVDRPPGSDVGLSSTLRRGRDRVQVERDAVYDVTVPVSPDVVT